MNYGSILGWIFVVLGCVLAIYGYVRTQKGGW